VLKETTVKKGGAAWRSEDSFVRRKFELSFAEGEKRGCGGSANCLGREVPGKGDIFDTDEGLRYLGSKGKGQGRRRERKNDCLQQKRRDRDDDSFKTSEGKEGGGKEG